MLAAARLYVCTDARSDRQDLEAFLHAAYDGGVDVIQLRDKRLEAVDELAALDVLATVARDHGRLFSVNDRADVAALVGADILHVGQGDLRTDQVRRLLGPEVIAGRSTRSAEQAGQVMSDDGLDYLCIGPVWETPTKPGRPAAGLTVIREVAELAARRTSEDGRDVPWFAIGGIDEARLPEVLDAGAQRIVVVRAVTEADDVRAAARRLRAALPS